jgi:hypothetical protein
LQRARVISVSFQTEEMRMRKTLAVLATVVAVGATAMTAPKAEARGFGPGLAFGLAAGALAAGAYGAYGPYYGPRYYGYYGPRYYEPAYGSYAYYHRPYYHHHYYRHW